MVGAEELSFVSASDGTRLSLVLLAPESSSPRGVMLLVHGFSQNRCAFLHGAIPAALRRAGFWVAVGELRGHGLSERPGTWTLGDHLRLDLPALTQALTSRFARYPVHLVGHSMGGMIGFASLAEPHCWASVTGIGAPLLLGKGSPLLGAAAWLLRPVMECLPGQLVPVDQLLKALSGPLSSPTGGWALLGLQRLVALTNPYVSNPAVLRQVLRASEPESIHVFRDFLRVATRRCALSFGDVEVEPAVRNATIPVAAVVGGMDIFASPSGVDPLVEGKHAGPRRIELLPQASHVDLSVSESAADAIVDLLPFLEGGA